MNICRRSQLPVEHWFAEHRRLHVMLQLARSAILHSGGPYRKETPVDLVRVLRQVRDAFANHFAEEEASNCLAEFEARFPELSDQARRTQREHSELLDDIDKIIAQTLDSAQSVADQVAIEKAFDDLCEQLHAHEAAENELLQQALARGVCDESPASTLASEA